MQTLIIIWYNVTSSIQSQSRCLFSYSSARCFLASLILVMIQNLPTCMLLCSVCAFLVWALNLISEKYNKAPTCWGVSTVVTAPVSCRFSLFPNRHNTQPKLFEIQQMDVYVPVSRITRTHQINKYNFETYISSKSMHGVVVCAIVFAASVASLLFLIFTRGIKCVRWLKC